MEGSCHTPPPQKKNYWKLLRNVIRAVALFRTHEAEQTQLAAVVKGIAQIPTDKAYRMQTRTNKENSPESIAIKDLRREQRLFESIERGSPIDLETIRELVETDPYKYIVVASSPNSLINKKDIRGYSPLYTACKHGNVEVVKLLLELGVDHLLTCTVDNETENGLEVAVRWGHITVVQVLLSLDWPKTALAKANRAARSYEMCKLMQTSHSNKACCTCF